MMTSAGGNLPNGSQPASGHGEVVQTAAEKAREKRLRDDPMAYVLGPLFVICNRCGSRIKLSPKSTYDPFHWQKHKERCLKKPAGTAKPRGRLPRHYTPPLYSKHPPTASTSRFAVGSTASSSRTTDEEEEFGYNWMKKESPSPGLNASAAAAKLIATLRPRDLAFEDYMANSHRTTIHEIYPPSNWRSWSWSQLKPAVWDFHETEMYDDDVDTQPPRQPPGGTTSTHPHRQENPPY